MPSTPLQQFYKALRAKDAAAARALLETEADVRAAIDAPIPDTFGTRPVMMARKDLPLLDVLLEFGANLNLKSDWWAGPFGLLEHNITPEEAAPLIERGALIDIFAAAHLGMMQRVRYLVEGNPAVVFARGGDGKTALHCARTVEIAQYLLDHGAAIDARDVDHESTPAQYLIRDAPDVARLLVDRGAWLDIYIAIGLRDAALVERCLRDDAAALDHRTGQGLYQTEHMGQGSRREIPGARGDTYRWVFGHNVSPIDAARVLGFDDMAALLLRHASPVQQLLAACSAADRAAAKAVVAAHPAVVSTLTRDQMRLLVDKAYGNDTASVALLLDLGFDPLVLDPSGWEPIRWAGFHGNAEMMRMLLPHAPPLNTPDRSYGGTILGNTLYGSLHGWSCQNGPCDYVATIQLLLDAGERVNADWLPFDRSEVDAVLRAHIQQHPDALAP